VGESTLSMGAVCQETVRAHTMCQTNVNAWAVRSIQLKQGAVPRTRWTGGPETQTRRYCLTNPSLVGEPNTGAVQPTGTALQSNNLCFASKIQPCLTCARFYRFVEPHKPKPPWTKISGRLRFINHHSRAPACGPFCALRVSYTITLPPPLVCG